MMISFPYGPGPFSSRTPPSPQPTRIIPLLSAYDQPTVAEQDVRQVYSPELSTRVDKFKLVSEEETSSTRKDSPRKPNVHPFRRPSREEGQGDSQSSDGRKSEQEPDLENA